MKALQMKYQMKQSSVIIIKSTSIVIPIITMVKPSITYYSFGSYKVLNEIYLKG